MSQLQAEALVVHLYLAAAGPEHQKDLEYLCAVWRRCKDTFGMTEPIAGLPTDLDNCDGEGLLAALRRPTLQAGASTQVQQALLRREHDTLCLSVMREPSNGRWVDLEREWTQAVHEYPAPPGLLGVAQLFLARVVGSRQPDPDALAGEVLRRLTGPAEWWRGGVKVQPGFAVWEASDAADDRIVRRIVVVAADDDELSGWTWVAGDRELPRFARYLLHAAKLRYERRIWGQGEQRFRTARRRADAVVDQLLAKVVPAAPGAQPDLDGLIAVSQDVVALQTSDVGLLRTAAALQEMQRTVQIAAANLTGLSDTDSAGLFADDRGLGSWFAQQLADDETYLTAARERAGAVARLTDQMLQRELQDRRDRAQRRQERFNLALTGVIGAILMILAAVQSFGYVVPLPVLVQPGVVAALGAAALLASLLVLRAAVPDRRWSLAMVWLGCGLLGASVAWVATSAIRGDAGIPATVGWAAVGFVCGATAAAFVRTVRTRSE